jgi:hypothetical protein
VAGVDELQRRERAEAGERACRRTRRHGQARGYRRGELAQLKAAGERVAAGRASAHGVNERWPVSEHVGARGGVNERVATGELVRAAGGASSHG